MHLFCISVNFILSFINLLPRIPTFNDPDEDSFQKHCRKGENTVVHHFLFSIFYSQKTRTKVQAHLTLYQMAIFLDLSKLKAFADNK